MELFDNDSRYLLHKRCSKTLATLRFARLIGSQVGFFAFKYSQMIAAIVLGIGVELGTGTALGLALHSTRVLDMYR